MRDWCASASKGDPIPAANFAGNIICRVLELEPARKLKITWGEGTLDTTVLWQLTPEGTGTAVRVQPICLGAPTCL